jgi:hypothetical protein
VYEPVEFKEIAMVGTLEPPQRKVVVARDLLGRINYRLRNRGTRLRGVGKGDHYACFNRETGVLNWNFIVAQIHSLGWWAREFGAFKSGESYLPYGDDSAIVEDQESRWQFPDKRFYKRFYPSFCQLLHDLEDKHIVTYIPNEDYYIYDGKTKESSFWVRGTDRYINLLLTGWGVGIKPESLRVELWSRREELESKQSVPQGVPLNEE